MRPLSAQSASGTRSQGIAASDATRRPADSAGIALLIVLVTFVVMWLVNVRYREFYQPDDNDITALADGLLLVPGASWQHWFTQGHSHFFDAYPEWPAGATPFSRPAFQFLIYLAHFLFGREWSYYLTINYLGVAGVVAVAFIIGRTALRLGNGPALVGAALVLVSPAVTGFSIWRLGFASEALAGIFVGSAFLAVISRRDLLCTGFLLIALMTKETAAWAPFAAALTVVMRPDPPAGLNRRIASAAVMLVPVGLWLAIRITFYGGMAGGYATHEYGSFVGFSQVAIEKFMHLDRLFVAQDMIAGEGKWALIDRAIRIVAALLVAALLINGALRSATAVRQLLGRALDEGRWPVMSAAELVMLWAALGLAFYFVLALANVRYGTAAVMFGWPALVRAAIDRSTALLRPALAVSLVLSLARTSSVLVDEDAAADENYRAEAIMNDALRHVPSGIKQVYVISARGLVGANPDYIRPILNVQADIIRVVDVVWGCTDAADRITFSHEFDNGTMILSAKTPACAPFHFSRVSAVPEILSSDAVRRSSSLEYQFPHLEQTGREGTPRSVFDLGSQVTVRIRPDGRARFIIEKGGSNGSLAWFDAP